MATIIGLNRKIPLDKIPTFSGELGINLDKKETVYLGKDKNLEVISWKDYISSDKETASLDKHPFGTTYREGFEYVINKINALIEERAKGPATRDPLFFTGNDQERKDVLFSILHQIDHPDKSKVEHLKKYNSNMEEVSCMQVILETLLKKNCIQDFRYSSSTASYNIYLA